MAGMIVLVGIEKDVDGDILELEAKSMPALT